MSNQERSCTDEKLYIKLQDGTYREARQSELELINLDREARLRELLEECYNKPIGEGLRDDIAYALEWIADWRCIDCGVLNRPHHVFCVQCGAGVPEEVVVDE